MTHDEIFAAVTALMRDYFDDDSLNLTPQTTADDVPEWDSMNHVNIIIAIEQKFKIKFQAAEVENLANVGDLVAAVEKYSA